MKIQAFLSLCLLSMVTAVNAADYIKPFVLAASQGGDFEQVLAQTRDQLRAANFDLVGEYRPYDGTAVVVVSNEQLRQTATRSERGGYGAAMRVALSRVDGGVEISYSNPVYWANAYRLADNLDAVGRDLATALGQAGAFGTGEKQLTAADMRKYHYTFMMEYFDDPSDLNSFGSHAQAVDTIEERLAAGAGGASKVYRIDLGQDPDGRQMTLFGVGLAGSDKYPCSGDEYIMSRIDKSTPRHTAHLPYEMLVVGNRVEALYARFRIAISWPHLPMLASETGATFFSIMCAPDDIEKTLTLAAGGDIAAPVKTDK